MKNRQRWNPNWDRAIIALAQHKTVTAAAASLDIDRVTLYRYTKNPEFHSQLLRTLAFVNTAARTKLEAQSCVAADLLIQILNDPKEKTAGRMQAARFILNQPATRLSFDDLRAEEFPLDPPELDPEIPREPDFQWDGQTIDTSGSLPTGESLDEQLSAASSAELARTTKLLEAVLAARILRRSLEDAATFRSRRRLQHEFDKRPEPAHHSAHTRIDSLGSEPRYERGATGADSGTAEPANENDPRNARGARHCTAPRH